MLENSSYPFATKILEAIKRNEEAAAQGKPLEGISPELMSQLPAGMGQEATAALPAGEGMPAQPVPMQSPMLK
jgi:hypothetical protein